MNARQWIFSAFILISLGAAETGMASEFGETYPSYSNSIYSNSTDFSARRRSGKGGARRKSHGGSKPLAPACHRIRSKVSSVVGESKAACYIKLFNIETDCNYAKPQAAGNAGNGYAAYGLCSLERSPAVRARQGRGAACRVISTIEQQTRCCQSIMKQFSKSRSYFGPVRRGWVGKCD